MVDSIAESARKASAGTWRKPRVRIYDYNQVCHFIFYLILVVVRLGWVRLARPGQIRLSKVV